MTKAFCCALLTALALIATMHAVHAAAPIKTETGCLQDLIARLASREYVLRETGDDPRPYVNPGPALHAFRHLAATLAWGDVQAAARQAEQVDYELIEFVDARSHKSYYVLREDLGRVAAPRGWGSYIVNPHSQVDALVEVPHPVADLNTPEIGVVFEQSGARGFLLAGAHREKADVPDLVDSMFHQVHMAWVGPAARVAAWQIHGFVSHKHSFPADAHVVASTGDGVIAPEVENLDEMCETRGLASYVFNDKPAASRDNQRLNGGVPGVAFVSLAATANEQGRYSRSLGGSFVHVELESSVRANEVQRDTVATVIAAAMSGPPRDDAQVAAGEQPTVRLASYQGADGLAGHVPAPSSANPASVGNGANVAAGAGAQATAEHSAAAAPGDAAPAVAPSDDGEEGQIARGGSATTTRLDGARARRARKRSS